MEENIKLHKNSLLLRALDSVNASLEIMDLACNNLCEDCPCNKNGICLIGEMQKIAWGIEEKIKPSEPLPPPPPEISIL